MFDVSRKHSHQNHRGVKLPEKARILRHNNVVINSKIGFRSGLGLGDCFVVQSWADQD